MVIFAQAAEKAYLCRRMMNEATREFIRQHQDDDIRGLALRGTKDPEVDLAFALQQIDGHRRAMEKLPSWAAMEGIVWPSHLSMEQCSSEQTARYKAEVAGSGGLFVDLTAGFGVDAAFIAQGFQKAVCVELQPELCAISSANFQLLGLQQIEVVNGNGVEYLHKMAPADLVFIDPARRDEHGGRTYGIADCTPNVLEIIDELLEKARRVMIKLSPMLDWRKAVEDIGKEHVSAVHIVSVNNECKELLVEVVFLWNVECGMWNEKCEGAKGTKVVCVNLLPDGNEERFEFDAQRSNTPFHSSTFSPLHLSTSSPFHFIYSPNASVMKAGCFDLLAEHYGVTPLHQNSHLFVSDKEVAGFPGRGFVIERMTSMNKRELKESLAGITQANIAVRNFPMSADELRRRLKLRDGGDAFIFATTVENVGHRLFICRKIS
jgi:precorrin-6B methylase 2